ncbi:MAG: hypothetical protein HC892_02720 [Saprospiraceae bacterium]|nr:hypothetical protein [Saprospiraceae bacterium]
MTCIFLLEVVRITAHLLAITQKSPIKWSARTSYEDNTFTLAGALVVCVRQTEYLHSLFWQKRRYELKSTYFSSRWNGK